MVAKLSCRFSDLTNLAFLGLFRWILMSHNVDPKQIGCHLKFLLLQFVLGICGFFMPHWFTIFNRVQCTRPIVHSIFMLSFDFQRSKMLSMETILCRIFVVRFRHDPHQSPSQPYPFGPKPSFFGLIVAFQLDPWTKRWHFIDALHRKYTFLVEFHVFTIVCSPRWYDCW